MKNVEVKNNWPVIEINLLTEVMDTFINPQISKWVFRGQSYHNKLFAPIDRGKLANLERIQKLWLENESIRQFINTVEIPSEDDAEKIILSVKRGEEKDLIQNRVVILMLMQHYGIPTRLLDWSQDFHVALYFAVTNNYGNHDDEDGEIWGFDGIKYNEIAPKQWENHSILFDQSGGFDLSLPSWFLDKEPTDEWFIIENLPKKKFHRLEAQKGMFSITSKYDRDHALAIQRLFKNEFNYYCRYVINKQLKSPIRDLLKKDEIWQGTLFNDVAGVAGALRKDIFDLDS